MYSKILVATDGSKNSETAARHAVSLAEVFKAKIVAIYVVNEIVVNSIAAKLDENLEKLEKRLEEEGRKYLDQIEEIAKEKKISVDKIIRKGTPASEIVSEAKKLGVDLIVMGTHGEGGSKPLIGSVAERVINWAGRPVLVVSPPNPKNPKTTDS